MTQTTQQSVLDALAKLIADSSTLTVGVTRQPRWATVEQAIRALAKARQP